MKKEHKRIIAEVEEKYKKRDKRKKTRMKISGGSVKKLKLVINKTSKTSN